MFFISGYGLGIFGVVFLLCIAFYLPFHFYRIKRAKREEEERLRALQQKRIEDQKRLWGGDPES